MQGYFALTCFFLLILMVLSRAAILKRKGIQVIVFARTHHSDFLILPFVLFYVYHLLAGCFWLARCEWSIFAAQCLSALAGCSILCSGSIAVSVGIALFWQQFSRGN